MGDNDIQMTRGEINFNDRSMVCYGMIKKNRINVLNT